MKKSKRILALTAIALQGTVVRKGDKAPVSRREAAALAYGISIGLGVGYGHATEGGSLGSDPVENAARLVTTTMAQWADGERDRMLHIEEEADPDRIMLVEVSHG